MALQKKWLVFYTKSRSEKKALEQLRKFGYEGYLPLHKVVRQWSDRKKKVEVPLFNSYIFVYEHESRIPEVLQAIPTIAWNIRHNGKPAILRERELETIKRFIATGLTIESSHIDDIRKGDKVEVTDGPLKGMVGLLKGDYNEEKFSVAVRTIDQVLTVNINKSVLRKIDEGENIEEGFWN